jgi:hypothetical protein
VQDSNAASLKDYLTEVSTPDVPGQCTPDKQTICNERLISIRPKGLSVLYRHAYHIVSRDDSPIKGRFLLASVDELCFK